MMHSMKSRIYPDTSVFGASEEQGEFADESRRLMKSFVRGDRILVLSSLTLAEVAKAPDEVRKRLASIPEAHIERVELDAKAEDLAEAYIAAGVLTARRRADAQHVAIASIARVDVLVSWNFKHIVNPLRIEGFDAVNAERGYPVLDIQSPQEMLFEV